MAKIKAVIKVQMDPRTPVPEIIQVVAVMLQNNRGHEEAILKGVIEGLDTMKTRLKGSE